MHLEILTKAFVYSYCNEQYVYNAMLDENTCPKLKNILVVVLLPLKIQDCSKKQHLGIIYSTSEAEDTTTLLAWTSKFHSIKSDNYL